MTPKEQYEARKAERKRMAADRANVNERLETVALLDMLDRFVTAVECIADAYERDLLYKYSRPVSPQPLDRTTIVGKCKHGVALNANCEGCAAEYAPTAAGH